jgi:hypothetical protein
VSSTIEYCTAGMVAPFKKKRWMVSSMATNFAFLCIAFISLLLMEDDSGNKVIFVGVMGVFLGLVLVTAVRSVYIVHKKEKHKDLIDKDDDDEINAKPLKVIFSSDSANEESFGQMARTHTHSRASLDRLKLSDDNHEETYYPEQVDIVTPMLEGVSLDKRMAITRAHMRRHSLKKKETRTESTRARTQSLEGKHGSTSNDSHCTFHERENSCISVGSKRGDHLSAFGERENCHLSPESASVSINVPASDRGSSGTLLCVCLCVSVPFSVYVCMYRLQCALHYTVLQTGVTRVRGRGPHRVYLAPHLHTLLFQADAEML